MNKIFIAMIPSILLGLSAIMPLNATAASETYEQAVDRIVNQNAESDSEAETPAPARDVSPAADVGSFARPSAQTDTAGVEVKPALTARPSGGVGE